MKSVFHVVAKLQWNLNCQEQQWLCTHFIVNIPSPARGGSGEVRVLPSLLTPLFPPALPLFPPTLPLFPPTLPHLPPLPLSSPSPSSLLSFSSNTITPFTARGGSGEVMFVARYIQNLTLMTEAVSGLFCKACVQSCIA